MCSIDAHEKNNSSEHDEVSSGGGYQIPLNSKIEPLVSLSATICFIGYFFTSLRTQFSRTL